MLDREEIFRAALRVPPFTSPRMRKGVIRGRRRLARARRRAHERLGSEKLSRPALHDMDRKLERHLPSRPGFFVEAGGYDGYTQSNTYFLERFRGWRGVLVEPVPELYRECVIERPRSRVFNCALVADDDAAETVRVRYGGLMSLVSGSGGLPAAEEEHAQSGMQFGWDESYMVDVPARTLSSVLDEAGAPPEIDFLSLDVEGYEASVLRGLDQERYSPELVLVEMHDPDAVRAGIDEALGERYAQVDQLSPLDFLYRRRN
jgi:FkbM family methyltransferase